MEENPRKNMCVVFLNKSPQIQLHRCIIIITEVVVLSDIIIISTSFQISFLGMCADEMLALAD